MSRVLPAGAHLAGAFPPTEGLEAGAAGWGEGPFDGPGLELIGRAPVLVEGAVPEITAAPRPEERSAEG